MTHYTRSSPTDTRQHWLYFNPIASQNPNLRHLANSTWICTQNVIFPSFSVLLEQYRFIYVKEIKMIEIFKICLSGDGYFMDE